MRKIKFRAWDTQYKKMYPEIAVDGDGCVVYMYDDGYENYPSQIVMQYTGLKDKNGVEIYEGDIVRYIGQLNPDKYKLFIIEWDNKLAGFYAGGGQIRRAKGYEVIGNLYETPELLDKDKPMI